MSPRGPVAVLLGSFWVARSVQAVELEADLVPILSRSPLSMNAPVLVPITTESDPLEIAIKELAAKKIPLVVRRYLPGQSSFASLFPRSPPSTRPAQADPALRPFS